MQDLTIEDLKGKTLNLYLTNVLNTIFELSNVDQLKEITSLNYDKINNKLIIGVNAGFWVLSENSTGLKGVFYGE